MAHNTRRLTDAGTVIGTSADLADAFRDIDETTTKALNGADGGTFSAASTITIGGAGIQLACPVDMNGAVIYATSTYPLTHGAIGNEDDYIRLASGHAQTVRIARNRLWPLACANFNWVNASNNDGSVSVRYPGTRFMSRLRVHNRATISTVKVKFETNAHAALPAILPKFRAIRVDQNGTIEALRPSTGLVLDGFITMPTSYANLAAYEAGNAPQISATYTCTQNNVVDVSQYEYLIEIIDEDGANAIGSIFHFSEVYMTGITSLAPQ